MDFAILEIDHELKVGDIRFVISPMALDAVAGKSVTTPSTQSTLSKY
jgi:hypothetical protein